MRYGFVQDGQVAETRIKLRAGDTVVIDTVAGNVQLNALRRFLNEGFQAHLQTNELLHQVSLPGCVYSACTRCSPSLTYGLTPGCCCAVL